MSLKFIGKFVLGLHLLTGWGGAALGGYETTSTQPLQRYFSRIEDGLYTASARGMIKGLYYPYRTLTQIPQVWRDERSPW